MKTVTICSDDFGQNSAINRGILDLVALGRLQAVTVFSESSGWLQDGSELLEHQSSIDIGIHLNLTEALEKGPPLGSLNTLLIKSHLRLIDRKQVKNLLRQQIDSFTQKAKRLPDFLDGHQHVHAFPVISSVLIELIHEYWPEHRNLYVRNSSRVDLREDGYLVKKMILRQACSSLTQQLKQAGIQSPPHFAGVYDFDSSINFGTLFKVWLESCANQTLFMCHPSAPGSNDSLSAARLNEYRYLSSPEFTTDCTQHGIKLVPYQQQLNRV